MRLWATPFASAPAALPLPTEMPPPLVPPFASWTDSAERTRIDVALGGWLNRLRALVTRNAEKLAEVERVVETIRLVEGTATPLSTSSELFRLAMAPSLLTSGGRQAGRCPGIQYVADPFHGLEVHNLLRAIGLGEYVGSKESPPFGPVSPFLKARSVPAG